MNKLRKLIAIALLTALVIVAVTPAAAKSTAQDFHFLAGDPSQWGVEAYSGGGTGKVIFQDLHLNGDPSQWGLAGDPSQWNETALLTRKVNEYEGQHR